MSSIFNSVSVKVPGRNKFDLSYDNKLSCRMGQLVPFYYEECVPGDFFQISCDLFARVAPLVFPLMHQVDVTVHYFAVPNRLMVKDSGWPLFLTDGIDGLTPSEIPYTKLSDVFMFYGTGNNLPPGSLADYLGLPTSLSGSLPSADNDPYINLFPAIAYNLVYNEYYADENLNPIIDLDLTPGYHDLAKLQQDDLFSIKRRAYAKDYFTSALPFAQRGPQVTIPVLGSAPVMIDLQNVLAPGATPPGILPGYNNVNGDPVAQQIYPANSMWDSSGAGLVGSGSVYADLSASASASIEDLRTAFALQEFLEKSAVGGARYIEFIKAHFGVTTPDSRLQRPEYLGGGSVRLNVQEVTQTSESTAQSPMGNFAGRSYAAGSSRQCRYYCSEYLSIIGILSISPKPSYVNGLRRHWLKVDCFDYYFPEFAHLGEQEVYNGELSYHPVSSTNGGAKGLFGYQSRYAEYRSRYNEVHGVFKTTMLGFHLSRDFVDYPALNADFIAIDESNPIEQDKLSRIFAVPGTANTEHFYIDIYNQVSALRPMPFFANPLII